MRKIETPPSRRIGTIDMPARETALSVCVSFTSWGGIKAWKKERAAVVYLGFVVITVANYDIDLYATVLDGYIVGFLQELASNIKEVNDDR